jgi:hypothetical protein
MRPVFYGGSGCQVSGFWGKFLKPETQHLKPRHETVRFLVSTDARPVDYARPAVPAGCCAILPPDRIVAWCSLGEKLSLATALWPLAAKRAAARSDWLLVGAILIYLFANLPYLTSWPAVNGDEGREANAFWVASGVDPSAQTLDPIFRHDPLYKGGLQGLTTGISFRFFGLGLWQGRVVSLVWGGLLLVAVFLAGRRLYGPAAGTIAVLFLAVSQPWLVSSHIIRPDIVVATLVIAALYCALRGVQDGARAWSLLAGLLMGLSFDVHPNTLAFMPMVGFVYLAR